MTGALKDNANAAAPDTKTDPLQAVLDYHANQLKPMADALKYHTKLSEPDLEYGLALLNNFSKSLSTTLNGTNETVVSNAVAIVNKANELINASNDSSIRWTDFALQLNDTVKDFRSRMKAAT